MKCLSVLATLVLASSLTHAAPPASTDKGAKKTANKEVAKNASITIKGEVINYTATAAELTLTKDDGTARANIFYVSYVKNNVKDVSKRPVLFAFNGGPGSSAVWLHLGALGPKIVPTSKDGTKPLAPPLTVIDNPQSILHVADLVFIDPVTTGFSRTQKGAKPSEFHNVDGDIESVGDFIRRWVTENRRWSSPKFLLGESYGGVRAAGLSSHLQSRYGMQLNGVILLSSLLDFRTLSPSSGNDLAYITYLPALTATAHHHGKIKGDRDKLVAEAKAFSNSTYMAALHKGYKISDAEKTKVAKELSRFTSLPEELIKKLHLRVSSSRFRAELLAKEGKVIGRFDARVTGLTNNTAAGYPAFDPSFTVAKGPFSTAMLAYLTDDLGWKDKRVYEILTGKVHPWKWNANNQYVNLSSRLESAIRDNPNLRVLVQCGHTDLATPPGGILHSIDHLRIPKALRKNISVDWYDAGHMFYLNEKDLKKMQIDLEKFITAK